MKEFWPLLICGTLVLMVFIGGFVRCSEVNRKAALACVEKTGKPLECEAMLRNLAP